MSVKDKIYATPKAHIVDFAFGQAVTDAFPDMIRRSVPGYDTIISLLSIIAQKYYLEGTRVYDLGCSLGAATLAVHSRIGNNCEAYIAVDSSDSMIEECQHCLGRRIPLHLFNCIHSDIRETAIANASVVMLNFTLQFLPIEDRDAMIKRIFEGLLPGGVLIISEKFLSHNDAEEHELAALYHAFKAANGYSDLEISQKRTALENVMVLDTEKTHLDRLNSAGFMKVNRWYQCFNFISLFAVK